MSAGQVLTVRLGKELSEKINELSKETDRPKSWIIKKALESYLEDFEDAEVALHRLGDKNDVELTVDEVRRELGL